MTHLVSSALWLIARNVVNTKEIEKFIEDVSINADSEVVKKWLRSNVKNYLLRLPDDLKGLDSSITFKKYFVQPGDPSWMDGKTDLEKVVLDDTFRGRVTHVIDYLNTLTERELGKIIRWSFPDAEKHAEEWLKGLMGKNFEDEEDHIEVIDHFGPYTMVQVLGPKSIDREGALMGHCVSGPGHKSKILKGEELIYSIRDASNEPHATIRIDHGKIQEIKGKGNKPVVERYCDPVLYFINKHWLGMEANDLQNLGVTKTNRGYLRAKDIPDDTHVYGNYDSTTFNALEIPKNLNVDGTFIVNIDKLPKKDGRPEMPHGLQTKIIKAITNNGDHVTFPVRNISTTWSAVVDVLTDDD